MAFTICFITLSMYCFFILPPFSLIRDFGKQNTRGNVSKISVSLPYYRHIGSKSTNHSLLAWRRESQKVTLVAVIGGFRSDLSITRLTDGNFGNVSSGICFQKSRINENGGKRVCKSFWTENLTRTNSSFALCSACTFKSESVFSVVKKNIYFVNFDIVVKNKSNVV